VYVCQVSNHIAKCVMTPEMHYPHRIASHLLPTSRAARWSNMPRANPRHDGRNHILLSFRRFRANRTNQQSMNGIAKRAIPLLLRLRRIKQRPSVLHSEVIAWDEGNVTLLPPSCHHSPRANAALGGFDFHWRRASDARSE
jgi:hypothetical protein